MKRPILFLATIFFSFISISHAQQGPGGVDGASNNKLWFDASTLSLSDGQNVSNWQDRSGNGNDALQGTSSRKPNYRTGCQGGKPCLEFDGSKDVLRADNIASLETNKLTWFVVGKSNGSSNRENFTRTNYESSSLKWGTFKNGGDFYTTVQSGGLKAVTYNYSTDYNLHSTKWNGNNLKGYLNGGHQGTNNSASGSAGSGHNYTMLGASSLTGTGDDHLDGRISEMIVYTKTLSNAERIIVDNYLAAKYGLSMAANDKYAHDGTYGHHVAGIGQDGNGDNNMNAKGTSMMQMHSPDNLANGEYQLWGDDGNDTTWVSNVPYNSGNGKRINRIWRNDETGGDPGSVELVFHIGNNTLGNNSTYDLLVDSDTDFSDATVKQQNGTYSSSSGTVTFSGVNLSDDVHFTIANETEVIESVSSSAWNNTSTWNCGCIPSKNSEVRVLHDVSIGAAAEAGKLVISSTGSLTFNSADTLDIHGDFRMGSSLTPGSGALAFKADSTQSIDLNNGISPTFNNLHIANSSNTPVSFLNGGSQSVTIQSTGTVSFADGGLDVSGVNEFRLKSTSDLNTARIDSIPSGSSVSGPVSLERHIAPGNGNAGWINVASPLSGVTIKDMDDDIVMSGKPAGGFSDGCAWSGSGCDYSVLEYSSGALNDVTTTGTSMSPMKGFELFIGDDLNNMSSSKTIDVTGDVQSPGTKSQSNFSTFNTTGSDLALTGNPYASQIDWHAVHSMSQDLQSYYYVAAATGNYETYDIGSGTPSSELNSNGEITSFQGFWVEASGGSPSVNFDQSVKISDDAGFAKTEPGLYNEDMFGLKMSSKMNSWSCRSKVRFDAQASRDKDDGLDIPHRRAPVEEAPELVFLSRDNEELRRQTIHSFDSEVTLPVIAKAGEPGTYKLEAENVDAIGQYDCIKLIDRRTREEYDLRETEEFQFDVQDTNDYSPRFDLVLSNEGNCKSATSLDEPDEQERIVKVLQNADGAELRFRLARKQEVRMTLYDITGRPVTDTRQVNARTHSERFQKPESAGIYMIVMETEEGRITRRVKF